jgi:hypothetical protein
MSIDPVACAGSRVDVGKAVTYIDPHLVRVLWVVDVIMNTTEHCGG